MSHERFVEDMQRCKCAIRDSFICNMTLSYMTWYVTWLFFTRHDMTHSDVWWPHGIWVNITRRTYAMAVTYGTMVTPVIYDHGNIHNDPKFKYWRVWLAIHIWHCCTYATAVPYVSMVTCNISDHGHIHTYSKFKSSNMWLAIRTCHRSGTMVTCIISGSMISEYGHIFYDLIFNYECITPIIRICHSSGTCDHGRMYNIRTTDGGNQTCKNNNCNCQNFQQVFTWVHVHIKHVFSGVPTISSRISFE